MARKGLNFLKRPIVSPKVEPGANVAQLLNGMRETAFQGKNLAIAVEIWKAMLMDKTTIFFGLAGAMVPAGIRNIIVYLIENRLIDCLVSTGANLFHDVHETLGNHHWQGSPFVDDLQLRDAGIDRMYDVFALEREFHRADRYIHRFSRTLDRGRPYTTREFLYLLGKRLSRDYKREGILTSAYRAGVPIYCPAIGDSSIGIALAMGRDEENLLFDIIEDVKETALLVARAETTGVIFIGGGTPKNFIQQAEVTAPLMGKKTSGHRYAIQITTDAPHWGGLSGCTFEESQSWGKIAKRAEKVTVHCDSTIALPIIVTALVQGMEERKRTIPEFKFPLRGR